MKNLKWVALALMLPVLITGCAILEADGLTVLPADPPMVVAPMAPERIGVLCATESGNCVESWNGSDIVVYSDAGSTRKLEIDGATGNFTLGSGAAADVDITFDGNAQDFYIALDDSADDLLIGLGSTVGTTPGLGIDENLAITTYGDLTFGGTTPVVTIGDGGAEDTALVYDGNAQDFYVALDDTADDLLIGLGSTVGTTPAIQIDENLDLTLCDATASDCDVTFDGNAQDFYIALDDSADDLLIGLGATVGTTGIIFLDENQDTGLGGASAGSKLDVTGNVLVDGAADEVQLTVQGNATQTSNPFVVEQSDGTDVFWVTDAGDAELNGTTPTVTIGDAGEEDAAVVFDGNAQDFHVGLDDTADSLVVGLGSALGTTSAMAIDSSLDITLGDATESDIDITYDGNAQDFYIALDDSADDLILGLGATVGTTGIVFLDENQDTGLGGASAGAKLDVTGNVMVDGAADEAQLTIQHNATQTNASFVIEDSAGTDILAVNESPAAGGGGDLVDLTETLTVMDGSDTIIGLDMNLTNGNATGTGNNLYGATLDNGNNDPQTTETALSIGTGWDVAIDTRRPAILTAQTAFADFLGDTVPPEWDYDSGSGASDPALNAAQYGTLRATTPGTDTDFATDHAGVDMGGVFWSADQGGLVFEARVKIDNITNVQWCAGLTDTETMEMPGAIGGSDTITTTLTDGVVFCFDTTADTDEWFVIGVNGGTDATGNGASSVAPSAGVYQRLRIEAETDGANARFYIDGTLRGTLTANAVTAATLLTPVIVVDNLAAEAKNVDIDYIYVSADRN